MPFKSLLTSLCVASEQGELSGLKIELFPILRSLFYEDPSPIDMKKDS